VGLDPGVARSARCISKRSHASEVQEFRQSVGPPSTSRFLFVQRLRGGGFETRTPTVAGAVREAFVGSQQGQLGFAGLVAQG
jgi:hypothetical protein